MLVSACEKSPQSYIHQLSNHLVENSGKIIDYSDYVLSSAIRNPTIEELRWPLNNPKTRFRYVIDKYSLILHEYHEETSNE